YQTPELLLADEPVSAMHPRLAHHTLALFCQHAVEHNVTLVASLHAEELALAHFPRVIAERDGKNHLDHTANELDKQHM
ncbi:phosphonate ABC transporter, partial [Pseudomonas syringae pv. tagetis]